MQDIQNVTNKTPSKNDRLQIVMMKVADVIPYDNNPRKNDSTAMQLKRDIEAFGFKDPIVIDDNNVIVCGHARLKAAIMLGMEEVPCTYATGLTDDEIMAYRIADNKTAEIAGWDYDKLVDEMTSLSNDGFNLDLTGFNAPEQFYYTDTDITPDKPDKKEYEDYQTAAEENIIRAKNVAIVCESSEDRQWLADLIHETGRLKRLYTADELRALAQAANA